MPDEPAWQDVLIASRRLQTLLPDAVLVGGSAAASHAGHRVSFDHVLEDLRGRFDDVLDHLERTRGWVTSRTSRPVLILGSLDGIETGIRQLIRRRPLEVEELEVPGGTIRVPTLPEMTRIKAWMVLRRNATRDYLDLVALVDRMGLQAGAATLLEMEHYYDDQLVEKEPGSPFSSLGNSASRRPTTCLTSTFGTTDTLTRGGRTGARWRTRAAPSRSRC
jgi:hypothetical protein